MVYTECWATPKDLKEKLDSLYKIAEFDPAPWPRPEGFDGLSMDWTKLTEGKFIFLNPPYKTLQAWITKTFEEYKKGCNLILLVPANRSETSYWLDIVLPNAHVEPIRGRLRYVNKTADGVEKETPAKFPSCLLFFTHFN